MARSGVQRYPDEVAGMVLLDSNVDEADDVVGIEQAQPRTPRHLA